MDTSARLLKLRSRGQVFLISISPHLSLLPLHLTNCILLTSHPLILSMFPFYGPFPSFSPFTVGDDEMNCQWKCGLVCEKKESSKKKEENSSCCWATTTTTTCCCSSCKPKSSCICFSCKLKSEPSCNCADCMKEFFCKTFCKEETKEEKCCGKVCKPCVSVRVRHCF